MTNSEISDVFSLLSKLMDIHNENSFKSKSYSIAAFAIDKFPEPFENYPKNEIQFVKGIGQSTANKIIELIETGSLKQLNSLIENTPPGILELLKIKGIGPKKIAIIWHDFQIESPGELLYACNENRLIHAKGFGEKSQQNIKEALDFYFSNQKRYLYAQIESAANEILKNIKKIFTENKIALVGAYARQCDIVEELEFVIEDEIDAIKNGLKAIESLSFKKEEDATLFYEYHNLIPVHVYIANENNFGSVSFLQSCQSDFLQTFQNKFAIDFTEEHFENEEDIFENLSINYIPVYVRESKENIDKLQLIKTENIITTKDIKGIIHTHSVWSDGLNTIEEMANSCIKKGFEYLVMSDHSVSSFYANGLQIDRLKKQQDEIDQLNEKLFPFKIFKSIECDILYDGSLDYKDEVLATFDLVICSIHQQLKMTEEKAMQRLLNAIANPYTTILGHLTGRLLLSRKEYSIDHLKIIEACKQHHVAIEINANPRRLDIDWKWIQTAVTQNVLLSINPDAHSLAGIDDIKYGVLCAQKGLLPPSHNVSSMNLIIFENFINKKKQLTM